MKTWFPLAATAGAMLALVPALAAQQPRQPQPAPAPQAERPAPPTNERLVPGGARVPGFAVGVFNPTTLLGRRETLSLTPDQVTRLSTLETELRGVQEKAATDARPHREALQDLLEQSAPDLAQVRTHAQALMQVEQAARLATITSAVQAKAVLSPEQRGRVQGWADRGRERAGMRRQMPRPGPGQPGPRPGRMQLRRGMGGA